MTITPTVATLPNQTSFILTWTSLLTADATGAAIDIPGAADKTCQLVANTAGGATCSIQGSNDNTNWVTLTRADGTAAEDTAGDIFAIPENPRYIRAKLTTVGVGADWTVVIHAKTT